MSSRFGYAATLALVAAALLGCAGSLGDQQQGSAAPKRPEPLPGSARFTPLPPAPDDPTNAYDTDPAAAELGRELFFSEAFSRDGEMSCATCHDPSAAFAERRAVSPGSAFEGRNSPTLINAAHNRWFFWDGRADSLWSQALHPLESGVEFDSNRLAAAHQVAATPALRAAYEGVFGPLPALDDAARFPADARPRPSDPEHPEHVAWSAMAERDQLSINTLVANLAKATAAYERTLVAGNSGFDRAARGESGPDFGADARRGFFLFRGKGGCAACHAGTNFTDNEFHDIGVPPRNGVQPVDPGRFAGVAAVMADPFNAAGDYSDDPESPTGRMVRRLARGPESWGRFKTPSLRNVAETPPYMHNGTFATLRKVLEFYSTREGAVIGGHHAEVVLQPLNLTERELSDLDAFLHSLTDLDVDEVPGAR